MTHSLLDLGLSPPSLLLLLASIHESAYMLLLGYPKHTLVPQSVHDSSSQYGVWCLVMQGAAAQQHFLLYQGQQLDDCKTLEKYSIQHQDTLQLLLRIRCVCVVLQLHSSLLLQMLACSMAPPPAEVQCGCRTSLLVAGSNTCHLLLCVCCRGGMMIKVKTLTGDNLRLLSPRAIPWTPVHCKHHCLWALSSHYMCSTLLMCGTAI